LLASDLIGIEFIDIIERYNKVIKELQSQTGTKSISLTDHARDLIGHVYGRIVHIRQSNRFVDGALSRKWEAHIVEKQYLSHPRGIVVVDDFLTKEAFHELRNFCLESTVWFTNRYAHGRLGAFFRDGFNCPLLIQIAEELRKAFPVIIGEKHRLRQL
jgi:hypothetical protein